MYVLFNITYLSWFLAATLLLLLLRLGLPLLASTTTTTTSVATASPAAVVGFRTVTSPSYHVGML